MWDALRGPHHLTQVAHAATMHIQPHQRPSSHGRVNRTLSRTRHECHSCHSCHSCMHACTLLLTNMGLESGGCSAVLHTLQQISLRSAKVMISPTYTGRAEVSLSMDVCIPHYCPKHRPARHPPGAWNSTPQREPGGTIQRCKPTSTKPTAARSSGCPAGGGGIPFA